MKLSRAEILLLALTGAFLVFLVGFYLGRNGAREVLTVQTEHTAALSDADGGQTVTEKATDDETDAPETSAVPDVQTASTGLIDLNTATAEELETLPGIGEVLAGRIIAYRNEIGGFRIIDELMDVRGIGETIFGGLKDYITVG